MHSPFSRNSGDDSYDWAEITGNQRQESSEVIDYTGKFAGESTGPGEITPPRNVVVDTLGKHRLERTDVDETTGRKPWSHRPNDGRNYRGIPHELQR